MDEMYGQYVCMWVRHPINILLILKYNRNFELLVLSSTIFTMNINILGQQSQLEHSSVHQLHNNNQHK